jgi:hypothetical protein
MKRIFFLILFILTLLVLTPKAFAQLPELSLPGLNCGIAGDARLERCCLVLHPTTPNPVSTGIAAADAVIKLFYSVIPKLFLGGIQPIVDYQTKMATPCQIGTPSGSLTDPSCKCVLSVAPAPGYLKAMNDFCNRQEKPSDRTNCQTCANGGGVYSGIGCIKTDIKEFIQETLLGMGVGLAGGFALLCIIYAAFQMQSSQGNPEKLKKSQELITSCIMGLMLIIFSVFILRLIGVNILRIPGFS